MYTDEETLVALEHCISDKGCAKCRFRGKPHVKNCLEGFLDLINRQKAEIDRLEDMLDSAVTSEANAHYCYKDSTKEMAGADNG